MDVTNRAKREDREIEGTPTDLGAIEHGRPLMISLKLIDEDPNQPRGADNPGFAQQSIIDLAASYGPRGPKTPISLRENLEVPGRYIINHGHRRYRAAKVKKLDAIPSFIDNDYSEIDQLIENLQRNELTAQEIAAWIGRELTKGVKKTEIAKSIGKSAAFVSQHATLLHLPEPVSAAVRERKLNDVTVINELAKAFKTNPDQVAVWLSNEHQELTRGTVRLLRDYLNEWAHNHPIVTNSVWDDSSDIDMQLDSVAPADDTHPSNGEGVARLRKSILLVEYAGRPARLNLQRRPLAVGQGWLIYEEDGREVECNLAELKLIAILEGNT
jgi:ParB family chromosome partitioning protein